MVNFVNIAVSKELRPEIESLKVHKNQSCSEIVETGIKLLIYERNLINERKNFKDFRIIKGRQNQYYCCLCGEFQTLLVQGKISRETLGLDAVTEGLYFCKSCMEKIRTQFLDLKEKNLERT